MYIFSYNNVALSKAAKYHTANPGHDFIMWN